MVPRRQLADVDRADVAGSPVTAPGDRWIPAREWAAIAAAVGMSPDVEPAAVVYAMRARPTDEARNARTAAIKSCPRCDPSGWRLDPDGQSADVARRCDHRPTPIGRDVTEPIHQSTAATTTR